MKSVGGNARRKEGPAKLCGSARYVDDIELEGCLHGVTLRSTIASGTIREVRFDPEFPWSECVIATADDIPGANVVTLIENDQPLLADGIVRHQQEPILLVAHAEREIAYAALSHVHVEYAEETPVLTIEESLRTGSGVTAAGNVQKDIRIEKGDVETALADAHVVVEGEYRVPHQEHAYIENNGVAAWFDDDGTLVVTGSLQCPFYVHKAMKPIFDLDDAHVRVIQAETGGGFGGKEEYPNMIAGHAALLALKAGRPVKVIYDRHEDMLATTKRHPAVVRHRTGLTRDGRLVAQDIDVVMDGGAYVTLSPVVLSRGALHASGPYACDNVRVRARSVATNTPPNGAFRGFGAPQTLFAVELHWEKIAGVLGVDSLALRRKNLVDVGSTLATGQRLRESVGAAEVLERTVTKSAYVKKREQCDRWNEQRNRTWRGMGLSVVHHGSGFTGSGEVYLASRAAVRLARSGKIVVEAASTEIGQGTSTMFAQIVADALNVPCDAVDIQTPDTAKVPDSGPTVASRTCMVVGGLLQRAARRLETALVESEGAFPLSERERREVARTREEKGLPLRFEIEYEPPDGVSWDEDTYRGDAYAVYGYAAASVEVEVDRTTFEVTVRKITTAHDVGKAIHPMHVEGQIMGGCTQALGYALLEHVRYENGVMQNPQLTNYIIPTSLDAPPMEVEIVETPYARGPFGAKGVGEIPMDVPGPAVAAAIHQATGLWFPELPITPEAIARGIRDQADR